MQAIPTENETLALRLCMIMETMGWPRDCMPDPRPHGVVVKIPGTNLWCQVDDRFLGFLQDPAKKQEHNVTRIALLLIKKLKQQTQQKHGCR